MEFAMRGIRTVSKNLQLFRFFVRFVQDNESFTSLQCRINFKIGEEWHLYINLPDVLELCTFNLNYVFEEP